MQFLELYQALDSSEFVTVLTLYTSNTKTDVTLLYLI